MRLTELEKTSRAKRGILLMKTIKSNPSIEKAVDDFNSDWYAMYGEGTGICDL